MTFLLSSILAATITIGFHDLDHDLNTFNRTDADFVGVIDVDWHARRSGRADQAVELGKKCGYVATYTTDHFIYETPDEQHGVMILSHEEPKSRIIRKLPSSGKGKVFFVCEYSDCYVGVAELDSDSRPKAESLTIISNTVAKLSAKKPFFMADSNRVVKVPDPVLPEHSIVPRPVKFSAKPGMHVIRKTTVGYDDVAMFADKSIPHEGYRISVTPEAICVTSSDIGDAGAFYALQTLRQLSVRCWGALYLPCCEIYDYPRFPWRGMLIDEARHFYGKKAICRMLDVMAMHKLNVLHWHLTDDEAWRLPMKGARPSAQSYSEADIAEIVAYAKSRHIRIVPEVDLPGHSRTLLETRPDLLCFPNGEGAADPTVNNVLCPGSDATMKFVREMIASLVKLFPDSDLIHLGGDEANKVNWSACPKCKAREKQVGAKNVSELQAWFTHELAAELAKYGRRLAGWTEILYGGMAPENSVLFSWLGAEGGIAAARAGRDSVMCPHEWCYFNYEQVLDDDPFEYPWWSYPLSLERAYAYDPLDGMPAEAQKHVLGGQCCLWSNQIHSEPELHWKAWPRACATAEIFWSPADSRDFADFRRRMITDRKRIIASHVNSAPF